MPVVALLTAGLALAVAFTLHAPSRAEAVEFGCRIGRPSYCVKYGQMFCLRENSVTEARDKACELWTAACFACHARVPECLGGTRPSHKSPLCRACEAEWRDCMHAIDKAYWPNRRRKSAEDDDTSLSPAAGAAGAGAQDDAAGQSENHDPKPDGAR